ncbi:hypothetical protein [Alkalithermobacter paradoxus]|uniref:Uncharacterized protein n=1 Tax=Alkalithermobacter paradoxus TaxID=29349 RepID=A0A1V4I5Y3_9FIRM|nr:hypothetical protein CLOTH_14400 [[Clostridium] thermoalcaliphilum]
MVIGLVVAYLVIILIDISDLLKSKEKMKVISIYFSLVIIGFTISYLQIIGKAPTSPSILIENMVRSIMGGIM